MRSFQLVIATALAVGCTRGRVASTAEPTKANSKAGTLVIGAGALAANNESVYRAILDGRSGTGPFCIFPTAGANPDSGMASPIAAFERYAGPGTAMGV